MKEVISKSKEKSSLQYFVIPASALLDQRLKDSEKILLAVIISLCRKEGYCFASNGYFAKLLKVTTRSITKHISNLKKLGYISVENKISENNYTMRIIRIAFDDGKKVLGDKNNVSKALGTKIPRGIEKNYEHNNKKDKNINECRHTQEYPKFQIFWDIYPNKIYKNKCLKIWIEDNCEAIGDEIINSVKAEIIYGDEFPPSIRYLENQEYKVVPKKHYV